jgi:hypothetical protein
VTREATTHPTALRRALLLDTPAASSAARAIGTVATHSVVEPPTAARTLRIAIVHAWDGVRFAAAAASRAELVRRLADHVRRRAPHTLWPADARHVRSLLARGELEAAVEVYFGRVGERWEQEWLVTTAIVVTDDLADGGARAVAGGR